MPTHPTERLHIFLMILVGWAWMLFRFINN